MKELWLKNNSTYDIHIFDIGVKVPVGKTINAFRWNPYLTQDKLEASQSDGALAKKLGNGSVSIVKKPVPTNPHTLNHIKESDEPVKVKTVKSTVVIDTDADSVLDDDELGGFADYGLDGFDNLDFDRAGQSVVARQKQDPEPEPEPAVELQATSVKSTVSKQSSIVMKEQSEKLTNPVGPISQSVSPADKPFILVEPPTPEIETEQEVKQAKTEVKSQDNTVVVETETDPESPVNVKTTQTPTKPETKDKGVVMKPMETKDQE